MELQVGLVPRELRRELGELADVENGALRGKVERAVIARLHHAHRSRNHRAVPQQRELNRDARLLAAVDPGGLPLLLDGLAQQVGIPAELRAERRVAAYTHASAAALPVERAADGLTHGAGQLVGRMRMR